MNWLAAGNDVFAGGLPLMTIDWWVDVGKQAVITLVIGTFAVALMMVALIVLDKMTSYSIHKELAEKQNLAVAIVVGAMVVGVAMVVSSVAQG